MCNMMECVSLLDIWTIMEAEKKMEISLDFKIVYYKHLNEHVKDKVAGFNLYQRICGAEVCII